MVTVPDVVDLNQADAEAAILGANLTVGAVSSVYSDTVPAGSVISQTPTAGNSVSPGTAVDLVVSLGPGMVTVPDVVDLNQADAEAAILGANLTVGAVSSVYSDTEPAGSVISQTPIAGSSVSPGTAVDLVVSLGSVSCELPPDPVDVAPDLDRTIATTLFAATEFLYTGTNPIQTGVEQGTIEPQQVAALSGKVVTQDGNPLPCVTITILNRPEYGQTLSRLDGMLDMAVNGGGHLTVNYAKEGYLIVQRQVYVVWQDFVLLPDVVMIPSDSQVTTIEFGATSSMQVARGNVVTDTEGTRQATLLFPQGTSAEMVFSGGGTQSVDMLSVRATEYTVGSLGPLTMPAELPPTSGYTYAVELNADEAQAANAVDVRFNQTVYFYVENFVGFPAGGAVPTGYYDRDKGVWMPSDDGRVLEVVDIIDSLAELDIDGDGAADDSETLALLNITDAERQQLASLYSSGQSLWRIPITHFTPWDCNWPFGPPEDAEKPKQGEPESDDEDDDSCESPGSIIECQNQVLGEEAAVAGTPFTLHYHSDRVPGRKAAYSLKIPLSGDEIPVSLKRIDLEVRVAGSLFTQSFPAAILQNATFTWDRKYANGRTVQGKQPALVRIGYVYNGVYYEPGESQQSFGLWSGTPITGSCTRQEVTLWQVYRTSIGLWDAQALRLGGWSFDVHHAYDPTDRMLYLGNGDRHGGESIKPIIKTVAGNGTAGYSGDDGPATEAQLNSPSGVDIGSDGSLFIGDFRNYRIRRVGPNGIITTIAGDGSRGHTGDGGPATEARLGYIKDLDFGPDGSLYIAEGHPGIYSEYVRRIGTDGIITTVAAFYPAHVDNLAVGDDGSVYVVASNEYRIYRAGPDGVITAVAGNGTYGYSGDDGPATEAQIYPVDIDVGPDGSLYIADLGEIGYSERIRRVGPDGIITTVAGGGAVGNTGDGVPATEVYLNSIRCVAMGLDGSLYIAEQYGARIRRVGSDGIIATVAGTGNSGYSGDDGPAAAAQLGTTYGLAVSPDGSLYLSDWDNHVVRQMLQFMPGLSLGDIVIASGDASELYIFDHTGRHLRTLHALTGAMLYEFGYDSEGQLIEIRDGDGNVTTIERDANGDATTIVAPFGQQTELGLYTNGYLTSITNPVNEVTRFRYTADGLLTEMIDPRNNSYYYAYNDLGRLEMAADPAGGSSELSRNELNPTETIKGGHEVTLTTAMGRSNTYRVEDLLTGEKRLLNTVSCCGQNETLIGTDGTTQITFADGTTTDLVEGPDPRFGMQAPLTSSQILTTPEGLVLTTVVDRTVNLADPDDLLSITTMTETVTNNGRVYTSTYDASQKLMTSISPVGRKWFIWFDEKGRVKKEQDEGLVPVEYIYDANGRIETIAISTGEESRLYQLTYNTDGYLHTIIDPVLRTTSFDYDTAGRLIHQVLPDSREIFYSYDANGNVSSITPPGSSDHIFTYTPVDLREDYSPPEVSAGANLTHYDHNPDRQPDLITRPDGKTIDYQHNAKGQLQTIILPRGQTSYSYDPVAGHLTAVTAPDGGTISYTWDGTLLTSKIWAGGVAGRLDYSYNNNMYLDSLIINGIYSMNYNYDDDSLLVQAGDMSLTRDPQNDLILGTALDKIATSRTYSDFAELTYYRTDFEESATYEAIYGRDDLGRITSITETIDGVTVVYIYTYDPAGRLWEVHKDGAKVSNYDYDPNGNRVSYTDENDLLTTGIYDDQDRLLQYGNATYNYTDNGELHIKTENANITIYNYDLLGNLMNVSLPDETEIEYIIDGRNHRIGKKVNGSLVQGFLYGEHNNVVAELDGTGKVISTFVYGSHTNIPDYMIRDDVTYRIISAHLGGPRMVVNVTTGAVVQRMDYDEFGNVILDTNPGFQPFGFAGGIYDRDTGLVRFGARDYDPSTGRWTSKDPLLFNMNTTNLYVYVVNDPVNWYDPDGLWHRDRKKNNRCPKNEPKAGSTDCSGQRWSKTRWAGKTKYRSHTGSECMYDNNGKLLYDWGSYNYGANPYTPIHWALDWLADVLDPNYDPNLSRTYECTLECDPDEPKQPLYLPNWSL